jgi:hypothetical protein
MFERIWITPTALTLLAIILLLFSTNANVQAQNGGEGDCANMSTKTHGNGVQDLQNFINEYGYSEFANYNEYLKWCDPNIQICQIIEINYAFSCLEFNYTSEAWGLTECTSDIFPLCTGRVRFISTMPVCYTKECCQQTYDVVSYSAPAYSQFLDYGTYIYEMDFYNQDNTTVSCSEFEYGHCVLNLYFGASSDESACEYWNKFQKVYDGAENELVLQNDADELAFSLW